MVQATLCTDGKYYANFTKRNLRYKESYLNSVNWETADFLCVNKKCRHVTNGLGNYVSRLEKELAKLKLQTSERKTHVQKGR
jgi:hypothetical protein